MFHKAQMYAALAGNIPIYPLHLPARLWWQRVDQVIPRAWDSSRYQYSTSSY